MVELNKHQEAFEKQGVEIIAVFREEQKGVEGLKIIREKTKTEYTLCLDTGKKKTPRYSSARRRFDNYVIGPDGKVAAIIEGDLRNRAKSEELLKVIADLKK